MAQTFVPLLVDERLAPPCGAAQRAGDGEAGGGKCHHIAGRAGCRVCRSRQIPLKRAVVVVGVPILRRGSVRKREGGILTGPMATPAMPGKYELGAELKMPRPVVPVARLVAPVLLNVVNAPVLGVVAPIVVASIVPPLMSAVVATRLAIVPSDVSEDAVTPDARVAPVSVPAAAAP
jgi:hypothetical protein